MERLGQGYMAIAEMTLPAVNITLPNTHRPNLISSGTVSTDRKPFGTRKLIMQMKPLNISYMSLPRLGLSKAKLQMKAGFFASISLKRSSIAGG